MGQHRGILATNWQADKEQLQDGLDGLHSLIDRLSAMEPEYHELIRCAQQNLQDAYVLQSEINTFATSLELSFIPRQILERGSTETPNEPAGIEADI